MLCARRGAAVNSFFRRGCVHASAQRSHSCEKVSCLEVHVVGDQDGHHIRNPCILDPFGTL